MYNPIINQPTKFQFSCLLSIGGSSLALGTDHHGLISLPTISYSWVTAITIQADMTVSARSVPTLAMIKISTYGPWSVWSRVIFAAPSQQRNPSHPVIVHLPPVQLAGFSNMGSAQTQSASSRPASISCKAEGE